MTDFSTNLTLDDVTILIDSIGHWESSEDNFLHFCDKLRALGDPPQEIVEQLEEQAGQGGFMNWWNEMKSDVLNREQRAKDDKKKRMDEACLLKTKLILLKRQLNDEGIDSLFNEDISSAPKEDEVSARRKIESKVESKPEPKETKSATEPPKPRSATEPPKKQRRPDEN